MPAMDFPASPTNGQVYGAYTYDSTKGAWRVTGVQATSVISSATPPSNPTSGNLWFNTNDGVLFTYFNDGNSSQWVEVKSNTASGSTVAARVDALEAKPPGLVAITPSSVSVGSGTATVGTNGAVTFTSATNITLNNVFTSAYKHYQIVLDISNATAQEVYGWFTGSGGAITTAWYGAGYVTYYSGSSNVVNLRNNGNGGWVTHAGPYYSEASLHVFIDTVNNRCQYDFVTFAKGIGAAIFGGYGTDGAATGFQISAASGASTGTIRIYGMR